MFSIFTCPKPFVGHIDIIQKNAIQSWLQLDSSIEVWLCGDDEGIQETAEQMHCRHISGVATNKYGTPLLSDVFTRVAKAARHNRLVFANTDIIFMDSFYHYAGKEDLDKTLIIGGRSNVDIIDPLSFDNAWQENIKTLVLNSSDTNFVWGSDYFVFDKYSDLTSIPKFAVGRPGWDNWVIRHARELGWRVLDASPAITVVHQNHDYAHVESARGAKWDGPEGDENLALFKGKRRFNRLDCTHWLTRWGPLPCLSRLHFLRLCETFGELHPERKNTLRMILGTRNLLQPILKLGLGRQEQAAVTFV